MGAIFAKEFKGFFNSALGYVYCAIMIILLSVYFYFNNLAAGTMSGIVVGYPYVSYAYGSASQLLMLIMPLITMRTFSEEMKNKTDQVLFTSPISHIKIVIGKFLACAAIYAIPMAFAGLLPVIIKIFGQYSALASDYIALLFLFIYGLVFIAIGMFISSLTDNIVVSALISFVVVFIMSFWGTLFGLIPDTQIATVIAVIALCLIVCVILYVITRNYIVPTLLFIIGSIAIIILNFTNYAALSTFLSSFKNELDFGTQLRSVMGYFIFDIKSLVLYISTTAIFLVMTVQSLHKRSWN